MVKRKSGNKIYNKIVKSIKNNSDILKINSSIDFIKFLIDDKVKNLSKIEIEALVIKGKIDSATKNVRMENLIEELPALTELEGDFSKKLRFKDLQSLHKISKKSSKIIDEQQSLMHSENILNIELLQKKIEIILNNV